MESKQKLFDNDREHIRRTVSGNLCGFFYYETINDVDVDFIYDILKRMYFYGDKKSQEKVSRNLIYPVDIKETNRKKYRYQIEERELTIIFNEFDNLLYLTIF